MYFIQVGEHIDQDCESDPAKEKRKVYTVLQFSLSK